MVKSSGGAKPPRKSRTDELPDRLSPSAVREALGTLSRELRALPAAWFEPGIAERISEWMKRVEK